MKIKIEFARKYFLIYFFVNFVGCLWGLDPQKKITQYTLNTWKTERGLPNNSIIAITQDRSGYLWLGTQSGLVVFDGVDFKIFSRENTIEFRDNFINNLISDNRGILWIGSYGGQVLSREGGKFTRHFLTDKMSNISNHCLVGDRLGNVWVGTASGLFCRSAIRQGSFKEIPEFVGGKIYCLLEDRSGVLWVATRNSGLFRRKSDQWQQVLPDSGIMAQEINVLYQDRAGCLWIGMDNGLLGYQNGKVTLYSLGSGMSNNVNSLLEDRDGNLWVASDGGLHRWQNGKFQSLPRIQGLDSNYVYSLYEDFEGSLWVGTVEGGLAQIRDEKITAFTSREVPPELNALIMAMIDKDPAQRPTLEAICGDLQRLAEKFPPPQ